LGGCREEKSRSGPLEKRLAYENWDGIIACGRGRPKLFCVLGKTPSRKKVRAQSKPLTVREENSARESKGSKLLVGMSKAA